jgi:hypothetical protein
MKGSPVIYLRHHTGDNHLDVNVYRRALKIEAYEGTVQLKKKQLGWSRPENTLHEWKEI